MKRSRHWAWLLLLIPIALGLLRLRLDVEVMNLLPDRFPVVRGLKLYQSEFANARELIITVESADAELSETAARTLALRLRHESNLFARATWQPLWMEHPGESAELVAHLWFNQPPEVFGELTNRLASTNLANILRQSQEALATSFSPQDLARLAYDPLNLMRLPESVAGAGNGFGEGSEFFASADGTFRVIFAEAATDISNYKRCAAWLKQVRALIERTLDAEGFAGKVRIGLTGRPAFVTEISSSMEKDLTSSVTGTMFIIAALFWWAHRRWLPLLWVLALLTLVLAGTMALGGLIFGMLSGISMGFAAILLGLGVDYGLVLYQEAQASPQSTAAQLRHELGPGIIWSAVTTAGAFAILNFGGLPGLGQLGTLVALGIVLAAVVMLYAYLPPLLRHRTIGGSVPEPAPAPTEATSGKTAWMATAALVIVTVATLAARMPAFDNSADALRPRESAAYQGMADIKRQLKRTQEPLWILAESRNEAEMLPRLAAAKSALAESQSNGLVATFTLPDSLWPHPAFQQANRAAASGLAARTNAIRDALLSNGFTTNSFALAENMLRAWGNVAAAPGVAWPTNESSQWLLEKLIARSPGRQLALGLIYRNTSAPLTMQVTPLLRLADALAPQGVYLSGWEMLGHSVFDLVKQRFPRVLIPMLVLLLVSLWLAFRNAPEVILSLTSLALSGALLLTIMTLMGWFGPAVGAWLHHLSDTARHATGSAGLAGIILKLDIFSAGWDWNLMNLMAVPLLLGSGVDYSIHMQLALRRHRGNVAAVRRTVTRALLLCGGTTIAGFGSLALSNNLGMASLGKTCATGIACCLFTAVCLLPTWWRAVRSV